MCKKDTSITELPSYSLETLYGVQLCALQFWVENPHYNTLHSDFKKDSEMLLQETLNVKSLLMKSRP